MKLNSDDFMELYRQMVTTRTYDTLTDDWYRKGLIKESVHQSIGQEAIPIGSCYAIGANDYVLPSLRTRGVFIARNVPIKEGLRAMCAKKTSPSKGHETSHHTCYPEYGILPGTGMVGSAISIGTGAALAIQYKRNPSVVLNYFGDGASNRGDFHEAVNLAGAWKLPCIYILENNGIALSTNLEHATACTQLVERAKAYGIPGYRIDGNDVLEVYTYTKEAVERARAGEGPTLLECMTTRFGPHVGFMSETRQAADIEALKGKCPIKRLEKYLTENGIATVEELTKIREEIVRFVEDTFAEVRREPDCVMEDMLEDVYGEGSMIYE